MGSSYLDSVRVFVLITVVVGTLLAGVFLTGCASSSERESTVRTTTTESMEPRPGTTVSETQTETNTEVNNETHESHGILSSFVHFVGAVIAFPFKVIGGAIGAIF